MTDCHIRTAWGHEEMVIQAGNGYWPSSLLQTFPGPSFLITSLIHLIFLSYSLAVHYLYIVPINQVVLLYCVLRYRQFMSLRD